MENKILIIDLETTGFLKAGGKIVEVGIVELDLSNGNKQILFDKVTHEPGITLDEVQNSWIVKNSSLTIDSIKNLKFNLETLPQDYEDIDSAKKKILDYQIETFKLKDQIIELKYEAKKLHDDILMNKSTTDKIVEKCDEAYRITTTNGLASAFDLKSKNLNISMIFWIIGLTISLILGGYIGSIRVKAINELLMGNKINNLLIIFNVLFSIISVGGPIWFAWLATKQINQRFKLAEDYGYKASVAKAYEGYRKEAFRLDVKLEERLFSSALSRLEEAPLRLLESKDHSSPWQELINDNKYFNKQKNITNSNNNDIVNENQLN